LERLRSGADTSIERNVDQFFDLTYPSEEVHSVLRGLSDRFSQKQAPGTILAESVKGLGKSHLLLLGYHLFQSASEAKSWAAAIGYEWNPPRNVSVIVHKCTDRSLPEDGLWLLIGEHLGQEWPRDRAPDIDKVRSALQGRHLVLILDELEQGIRSILEPARRAQNIAFLQMLSEAATRGEGITLFAAVYDGNVEPGSTLKRSPRVELRFRKSDDRAAIVRHRLFKNAENYDRRAARDLIRSYANTWKRLGVSVDETYMHRMESTFPFLPELIELVFERIINSGGFQGTRSALGLLGAMVDAAGNGTGKILSAAHCLLTDVACANRMQDLDPAGSLISCATGNQRTLCDLPLSAEIASAVLLSSLVPGGRFVGLAPEELIRHVARPGTDPNEYHATLDAFRRFGTYFHERDGRVFFDREENEHAKVELEASRIAEAQARHELAKVWQQEVFKDTQNAVIYEEPDAARDALEALPTSGRRYILAPRRLSPDERHALYRGLQRRNQVLLLEPRDAGTNHLTNADLLAMARRRQAARALAESSSTIERRNRFEKIERHWLQEIQNGIRKAGLAYVRIDRWGDSPLDSQFEEESLGTASTRDEAALAIHQQVFPPALLQEHVRGHLEQFYGNTVQQVTETYRKTLGYPVPLYDGDVPDAIRALVESESRVLGLQHPRGGGFCGERVSLQAADLEQAVLARPWAEGIAPGATARTPGEPVSPPRSERPDETDWTESDPGEPPFGPTTEERVTTMCRNRNELRQQVAERLGDLEGESITRVQFRFFSRCMGRDLSTLPASFRGALSGVGDLDAQLEITLPGPFNKAQVEALCEKLPDLADAEYMARLGVMDATKQPAEEEI
jgi:hypothetical protein